MSFSDIVYYSLGPVTCYWKWQHFMLKRIILKDSIQSKWFNRRTWNLLPPTNTWKIHLQMEQFSQNTYWTPAGALKPLKGQEWSPSDRQDEVGEGRQQDGTCPLGGAGERKGSPTAGGRLTGQEMSGSRSGAGPHPAAPAWETSRRGGGRVLNHRGLEGRPAETTRRGRHVLRPQLQGLLPRQVPGSQRQQAAHAQRRSWTQGPCGLGAGLRSLPTALGAAGVHLCWQPCKLSTHRTSCGPQVLPWLEQMQPEQLGASWTCTRRAWAGPGSEHLQSPTAGAPLLWSWSLTSVELSWWPCEHQARRTPGPTEGSPKAEMGGGQSWPRYVLIGARWADSPESRSEEDLVGTLQSPLPCTTTQKHIWELLLPTARAQTGPLTGQWQPQSKEALPNVRCRCCSQRQPHVPARGERRADAEESGGRHPGCKQPSPPKILNRATQGCSHIKTALQKTTADNCFS